MRCQPGQLLWTVVQLLVCNNILVGVVNGGRDRDHPNTKLRYHYCSDLRVILLLSLAIPKTCVCCNIFSRSCRSQESNSRLHPLHTTAFTLSLSDAVSSISRSIFLCVSTLGTHIAPLARALSHSLGPVSSHSWLFWAKGARCKIILSLSHCSSSFFLLFDKMKNYRLCQSWIDKAKKIRDTQKTKHFSFSAAIFTDENGYMRVSARVDLVIITK